MTINHKVWDFPNIPIQSQLFHVPGAAFDGGLTSGGARILSPEPGGRSILETQIAFQVNEWNFPFSSWLMSKLNGDIFRVQLTKTPQLASLLDDDGFAITSGISNESTPWITDGLMPDQTWDNGQNWDAGGFYLGTNIASLEGARYIEVDTLTYGEILKYGHVIGHNDYSYMIDDIEYDGTVAQIYVSPPLRKSVSSGDSIYLNPYFLGVISNGNEIRNTYEASNVGHVQINRIVLSEVIIS